MENCHKDSEHSSSSSNHGHSSRGSPREGKSLSKTSEAPGTTTWSDDTRAVLEGRQANIARALSRAERRQHNTIHAAAIATDRVVQTAGNETLHANILVRNWRRAAIHRQRVLEQRSRSMETTEEQIRSTRDGVNQTGATLRPLRPTKITDIKDLKVRRRHQETRGNHRSCHAERGDQASHRDPDGIARVGNTPEAERRQIQHVCSDEVASGQLCQLEVADPKRGMNIHGSILRVLLGRRRGEKE